MGLIADRPDLLALLEWAVDAEKVQRYRSLPAEFREAAQEWLATVAGSGSRLLLQALQRDEAADGVAIALAASVVFHPDADGRLDKAAGRMEERFLGGAVPHDETIRRLAAAATELVRGAGREGVPYRRICQHADAILQEIAAAGFAYLSDTSPLGFDQRLAELGRQLTAALGAKTAAARNAARQARRTVARHVLAQETSRRMERIDMALRLIEWLSGYAETARSLPASFAAAADYQIAEGGYLDWARLTLQAGDPVRELADAYAQIFQAVTAIRELQSHHFATLLRDWTAAGSTGGDSVPVERLLATYVAPLAAHNPVLLIVLDGMSAATCRELLADIIRQGWVLLREDENAPAMACGVAAIPSVTQVSRASLLSGKLCSGAADRETSGFESFPELLPHGRNESGPRLFHKAALQAGDGVTLLGEVREAISSSRRVVGVVVNAIDDQLMKGEQVDGRWTLEQIRALPALLHEAQNARRLVVLTSDHGHVLESGTQSRTGDGGERWRTDNGRATTEELQISGSRVVLPASHSLIAPWSENIRYGAKKNGYHGGLTPQEMIVPLVVLSALSSRPDGWTEVLFDVPSWWDVAWFTPQTLLRPQIRPHTRKSKSTSLSLEFEEAGIHSSEGALSNDQYPDWIAALLSSDLVQMQIRLAGKSACGRDPLGRLLWTLWKQGGSMPFEALSRAMALPPIPLQTLIAAAQNVLNVDGFAILTQEASSDRIMIDEGLLFQQFDLA
jgi:hypothetical protein